MKKKIDVDFYRKMKYDYVKNMSRHTKSWDEFNDNLSLYCACTGLAVYVAIVFAEEEFPMFSKQLEAKRKVVKEFYCYE